MKCDQAVPTLQLTTRFVLKKLKTGNVTFTPLPPNEIRDSDWLNKTFID